MSEQNDEVWSEELKVKGEALLAKLRELIREGNVRRIIIKDSKDDVLVEIPLTVGVVGAVVAPVAAAVGAIAALAADYTITIIRHGPPADEDTTGAADQGPATDGDSPEPTTEV